MVKALSLGLLVATMCCIARCACAPAPTVDDHHQQQQHAASEPIAYHGGGDDGNSSTARSERSAFGMSRKIQFFIKNFHLQILPDGTVNGTLDDGSVYTILQRTAIGIGKLKIQGIGTCQYLCMDACGFLYGSREFHDECVFNEMIQEHHYNTYSSTKYSNEKRTLYLAFNRRGAPRKVLLHAGHPLGRLSSYTRVLTRTVQPKKLDELHPVRHHGHSCPADPVKPSSQQQQQPSGPGRCRRHKKRKKRKRKGHPADGSSADGMDDDSEPSSNAKRQPTRSGKPVLVPQARHPSSSSSHSSISNNADSSRHSSDTSINHATSHRCESDSEECQRVNLNVSKKTSAKAKLGDRQPAGAANKAKNKRKKVGGRRKTTPSPLVTTTVLPTLEEATDEGDYLDGTTALDWEDPTVAPTPEEAIAAATLPD